jgi:4-hydroxy-3-methylbut-2-enyl diphosphate reductase
MEVIKITPRGYCYGVVDALQMVRQATKDPSLPRPIYVLGQIIHNRLAVEALTELGVISLDGPDRLKLLEQIETGTVIFTAHGVSPHVRELAQKKNLHCLDATCPDVAITHQLVRQLAAEEYTIFYIGRANHPEPAGILGEVKEKIFLIEKEEDLHNLQLTDTQCRKIAVTTQTTLSQWDTRRLIEAIKRRYPHAEIHIDICSATQQRQEAVVTQARGADLTIVVGDPRSNNTNRLVQVSQEIAGVPAIRIENLAQLQESWLVGKKRIAVTAGASTPSHLTREVIQYLEHYEHIHKKQTT